MSKPTRLRYSPEVRARAVRMVLEHEAEYPSRWAALSSITTKIGCSAETLRLWLQRAEQIEVVYPEPLQLRFVRPQGGHGDRAIHAR